MCWKAQHISEGVPFMIFSRDRILTTHVGSLPRNEKLSDLLLRQEAGETFDAKEMAAEMDKAVGHVVERQLAAGIDIGNDGEQMKDGFFLYLKHRLTGLGGSWQRSPRADVERYPEFKRMLAERAPKVAVDARTLVPKAVGEVSYISDEPLRVLLLVALYQLIHTHAKPYAVVDYAVRVTEILGNPHAKGLANAVLRNFLRNSEALLAEVKQNEIARWNHPRWWITKAGRASLR
jgi:hypothetical protein